MKNINIYRETNPEFRKKIKYYKKLAIDAIEIDLFTSINDKTIADAISLAKILATNNMTLIIEIDVVSITQRLIGDSKDIDWQNPKIRNGLYQFINYLTKHGIRGYHFKSIEGEFELFIRELAKNTIKEDILTIASVSNPSLGQVISRDFDFIDIASKDEDNFFDIKDNILDKQGADGGSLLLPVLSSDNSLRDFVNFKNYPYKSHSLVVGMTYLLRGAIMLKDLEELGIYNFNASKNDVNLISKSNKTLEFYQKLLHIRRNYPVINNGTFSLLFKKDPDVLAYMKTYRSEKLIVFGNFSQREVLVDIRFHFIDLYDYKYLIGNYSKRTIVKNLLLRPYEFVAFIKA